jgi:hypothetical protein
VASNRRDALEESNMKKKDAVEPKIDKGRKLPAGEVWAARPFKGYDKNHSPAVKKGNSVIASGGSNQKPGVTRVQPSEGTRAKARR